MLFIHSPNARQKVIGFLLLAMVIAFFAIYHHWVEMNLKSFNFWYVHFILAMCLYLALQFLFTKSQLPLPYLPDPDRWRGPNDVPFGIRAMNVFASIALVAWGTYGLYRGEILMPTKNHGVDHVTGLAAWFLYGSILCAAVNLMAEVVDHYDRRNNELLYVNIAAATKWLGWALFIAAAIQSLLQTVA